MKYYIIVSSMVIFYLHFRVAIQPSSLLARPSLSRGAVCAWTFILKHFKCLYIWGVCAFD